MIKKSLLLILFFSAHLFSQTSVPVLDLEEYKNPETKTRFIRQMKNALEDGGVFALKNFGIKEKTLKGMFRQSRNFFSLNLDDKMLYYDASLGGQRGYTPGESAKEASCVDYKEFFSIGREGSAHKNHENIWPHQVPLKPIMLALFQEIEEGKAILERAFAEAVGLPIDFFNQLTTDGECLLRALHYPAPPPGDYFWSASHTDINLFSISLPSETRGLEYQLAGGEWVEAFIPENLVLIHAGDMIENLTNGLFHAPKHRVVPQGPSKERYSLIYYNHGRYSHRMDPLPQCIQMTGGKALYPKASVRELLEERLVDLGLADYDIMVRLVESGLIEREMHLKRASQKAIKVLINAGLATEEMKSYITKKHD